MHTRAVKLDLNPYTCLTQELKKRARYGVTKILVFFMKHPYILKNYWDEVLFRVAEWEDLSSSRSQLTDMARGTFSTSLLCYSTMTNVRVGLCKTKQLLAYAKKQWLIRTKQHGSSKAANLTIHRISPCSIASIELSVLHIKSAPKIRTQHV